MSLVNIHLAKIAFQILRQNLKDYKGIQKWWVKRDNIKIKYEKWVFLSQKTFIRAKLDQF